MVENGIGLMVHWSLNTPQRFFEEIRDAQCSFDNETIAGNNLRSENEHRFA